MYVVAAAEPRMFDFEIDGKAYSAPSTATFTIPQAKAYAEAAKGGDELAFAIWIVENVFPDDARDAVLSLDLTQLGALIRAYIAEGASSGESRA